VGNDYGAMRDEVMDYRGLSAYLKMAQGTLRHKVMRGEIPHFKIGHSVRFSKKRIDSWLGEYHRAGGVGGELFADVGTEGAVND